MFRKVLEKPWYFHENAYSKDSNNDNAVLTDSISSKYHGDSKYFGKPHEGTSQQLRASCYAELRSAATQSCAVLRRATLSYTELHEATKLKCYAVLRYASVCAMLCYAVPR